MDIGSTGHVLPYDYKTPDACLANKVEGRLYRTFNYKYRSATKHPSGRRVNWTAANSLLDAFHDMSIGSLSSST